MSCIKVKWNKQEFSLDIDLTQELGLLRSQLLSLSGVLPEKQKIMMKGKVLSNDETSLEQLGVRAGSSLMMMGTATELVEHIEEVKFAEDLSESEKARAYREREGIPMPVGLVNLGNTCYMNSTIQCLKRIPELSQGLSEYRAENRADPRQRLTEDLKNLIKSLESTSSAVTPFVFVNSLRIHNPLFAETDEHGHGKQQDAEECLSTILECIRPNLPNPLVDELFNFEMQSVLTCAEMTEEPPKFAFETAKKLMCVIDNQGNPVSLLADGIEAGLGGQLEKFSESLGRNAIYNKSLKISKLPQYAVVQMVRFIWKNASSAAGTKAVKAKILRSVAFPKVLSLYPYCNDELKRSLDVGRDMEREINEKELEENKGKPRDMKNFTSEFGLGFETGDYHLVGVVTHKGRSADSGHYVGWTHLKDDTWAKYDDDLVSQVSTTEIMDLKGGGDWHMAYLLVYRKMQLLPQ